MNTLQENRRLAAVAAAGISSEPIYAAALRAFRARKRKGKVLDFGAGTGSFAKLLDCTRCFSEVHAVDLLDYGNHGDNNIRWSFADLNSPLPFQDQSFEAISAIEVIEHLENPRLVAREWFRILRPSGLLVVSTPNNESWRSLLSLLVRGHFSAFTAQSYPAHITALLRLDLVRVLTEAGFVNISFSYTNSGGIPGRPAVTWQRVSFGFLAGLRFSDNIVCQAVKPMQPLVK